MRLTILVFGLFLVVPLEVESAQKQAKSKLASKVPAFVEADFVADIPDDLRNSLLDVEKRRKQSFESIQKSLAKAEQHLKMAQKGRIDASSGVNSVDSQTGQYTFGNKSQKIDTIEDRKKELMRLQDLLDTTATNPKAVTAFERKIRKGDIGVIKGRMKVRQVVNANTILAEAWIAEQNETILITEIDSSGLADDVGFSFSSPLLVKGTKSYTNVLGAKRTVFELAPFEIEKYVMNRPEANAKMQEKQRKAMKN